MTMTTAKNPPPPPPPSKKKFQGVLFDMDGTLLDTEPLGCKAVYQTLQSKMSQQALQEFQDCNYAMPWHLKQQTLGLPDRKWPPIVLKHAQEFWGVQDPPTVEEFLQQWDWNMQQGFSQVGAMKGAPELVQQLAKSHIPLAIATSSRSHAVTEKRKPHETSMFQYIQTVVTTDDPAVTNGKPAPDIFLEAAKRIQVDPKDCIVFEDGMTGCQAGKAAGCFVVAVPDRRTTPKEKEKFQEIVDHVLDDLTQFDAACFFLM